MYSSTFVNYTCCSMRKLIIYNNFLLTLQHVQQQLPQLQQQLPHLQQQLPHLQHQRLHLQQQDHLVAHKLRPLSTLKMTMTITRMLHMIPTTSRSSRPLACLDQSPCQDPRPGRIELQSVTREVYKDQRLLLFQHKHRNEVRLYKAL